MTRGGLGSRPRPRSVRIGVRVVVIGGLLGLAGFRVAPKLGEAVRLMQGVGAWSIAAAFALQVCAWVAYSALTRGALADRDCISLGRMARVQMSAKALGNVVPAGAVAAPALSHRLLVRSGVASSDAGVALGAAGLGSAVVLNVLLWCAFLVSIPLRGVNGPYVAAALVGALMLTVIGCLVVGLMDADARVERLVSWGARRLRRDPDSFVAGSRAVGRRLNAITADRPLMGRLAGWASLNWLLDAASLWCLLVTFGHDPGLDGVLIAFGIANVLAAVPLSPGGIVIVEWAYLTTLVGFGVPLTAATAVVILYRALQLVLPIPLGALTYLTLQWGPWSSPRKAGGTVERPAT